MYYGPECNTEAVRNGLGRLDSGTWFIEPGAPWESGYVERFTTVRLKVEYNQLVGVME